MKKIIVSILYAAAAIALSGCAKNVEEGPNDANKRYFDAWMHVHHPDAKPTGLGIYVLEETPGTGKEVETDGFVLFDYKVSDLDGNITSYTDKETAKQLGEYDTTNYYGPKFQTTAKGTITAGLAEALKGMKVGGKKKVIIPCWLMSYKSYSTEAKYLAASSSYANTVYEVSIADFTDNITEWQTDSIGRYFAENPEIFAGMTVKDTVKDYSGMYYRKLTEPVDTSAFPSDTTIYINYTGMLLNGHIFDTTIENVAKDNGLYTSGRDYKPVQINWGESYSEITMGSDESSIISGFALTLWQMRPMESGIGVFISDYGYTGSGSGSSIPPYSPLVFKIEIVEKPEE